MKQWMKKAAAVLLGGVLAAGLLSGCSRTIIEHQFHTEYVGDGAGGSGTGGTGGTTVVDFSESFRKLEQLLNDNGIVLIATAPVWQLSPLRDSAGNLNNTTIQTEDLADFVEDRNGKIILYEKFADTDEELEAYPYSEYIKTWDNYLEMLYEAFSGLTGDQWRKLWSYRIYIGTCRVTQDTSSGGSYLPRPPYYVEITITKM